MRTYEEQRAANMARNQAMLNALGLTHTTAEKPVATAKRRSRDKRAARVPTPGVRSSKRLRAGPAEAVVTVRSNAAVDAMGNASVIADWAPALLVY